MKRDSLRKGVREGEKGRGRTSEFQRPRSTELSELQEALQTYKAGQRIKGLGEEWRGVGKE